MGGVGGSGTPWGHFGDMGGGLGTCGDTLGTPGGDLGGSQVGSFKVCRQGERGGGVMGGGLGARGHRDKAWGHAGDTSGGLGTPWGHQGPLGDIFRCPRDTFGNPGTTGDPPQGLPLAPSGPSWGPRGGSETPGDTSGTPDGVFGVKTCRFGAPPTHVIQPLVRGDGHLRPQGLGEHQHVPGHSAVGPAGTRTLKKAASKTHKKGPNRPKTSSRT